jgi:hypothetical protein
MAFATRLPKVRDQSEHFNERTWMCYHQAPPWERVVAQVGDAGQAKPHLEHNPLSRIGVCHAIPIRKLNGPGREVMGKMFDYTVHMFSSQDHTSARTREATQSSPHHIRYDSCCPTKSASLRASAGSGTQRRCGVRAVGFRECAPIATRAKIPFNLPIRQSHTQS